MKGTNSVKNRMYSYIVQISGIFLEISVTIKNYLFNDKFESSLYVQWTRTVCKSNKIKNIFKL